MPKRKSRNPGYDCFLTGWTLIGAPIACVLLLAFLTDHYEPGAWLSGCYGLVAGRASSSGRSGLSFLWWG